MFSHIFTSSKRGEGPNLVDSIKAQTLKLSDDCCLLLIRRHKCLISMSVKSVERKQKRHFLLLSLIQFMIFYQRVSIPKVTKVAKRAA